MLGFGPIGSAPIGGGGDKRKRHPAIWNRRQTWITLASMVVTATASACATYFAIINTLHWMT